MNHILCGRSPALGWSGLCMVTQCTGTGTRAGESQCGCGSAVQPSLGERSTDPPCSSCWAQAHTILWGGSVLILPFGLALLITATPFHYMGKVTGGKETGRSHWSFCLGPGFYEGSRGCWFLHVIWETQEIFPTCLQFHHEIWDLVRDPLLTLGLLLSGAQVLGRSLHPSRAQFFKKGRDWIRSLMFF